MVNLSQLADLNSEQLQAYRLVNSKFPPIALFDDVANPEEFEALYQTQALDCPLNHRHLQPMLGLLNGHDAYAYLKDVLTRLPTQRASEIGELMPHR